MAENDNSAKIAGAVGGGLLFVILMGLWKLITGSGKKSKVSANGDDLQKGDIVIWEGEKYSVEAVSDYRGDNPKLGDRVYSICKMTPVDDVNIKVKCINIQAFRGEIKRAS